MLQAPAHLVLIASPAIHVTGDHASFPEKYTVSGGRSVMFVENVMIRHSTLNEPFTLYELEDGIILDTRPFCRSFCHGDQIPPCFWAIHPRGGRILVALIDHNHPRRYILASVADRPEMSCLSRLRHTFFKR